MRSHSAFTLVEVVIVTIIIGLLAAMAIPAYQKVRESSLLKAVANGESLTPSQRERYRELMKSKRENVPVQEPAVEIGSPSTIKSVPFQRIEVEGRPYYLVPKRDAKETEIAGRTFWLIPYAP